MRESRSGGTLDLTGNSPAARVAGISDAARLMLAFVLCGALLGAALAATFPDELYLFPLLLAFLVFAGLAAMPKPLRIDDRTTWGFLIAFIVLFSIYPIYVPIRLPGLPWISPPRLAAAILLVAWLHLFFADRGMHAAISSHMRANRLFFLAFGAFLLAQVASIPTAIDVGQALTRFSFFQLYWTFIFFSVLTLANTERRLRTIAYIIVLCAALQGLLGFVEAYRERNLFSWLLPAGFAGNDEALQRSLQGVVRFDSYRVQSTFSVSLVYAEYMVLVLPFAVHFALHARSRLQRVAATILVPVVAVAQYFSGSRSGMVGAVAVISVYAILVSARFWLRNRKRLIATVLLALAIFAAIAAVGALLSSNRAQTALFGGGQHQASNEGRLEQFRAGLPMSLARPLFGYGIGLGAEALGFRNLGGILTIDSYLLSLILEVGYVGLLAFLAMLGWAIFQGARLYLTRDGPIAMIGGAITAMLVAFTTIKLVLSQIDNHMLIFLCFALLLQLQRLSDGAGPAGVSVAPVAPRAARSRGESVSRLGKNKTARPRVSARAGLRRR